MLERLLHFLTTQGKVCYIGPKRNNQPELYHLHSDRDTLAAKLYAGLRQLDGQGVAVIVVRGVESKGINTSVMDRLGRASSLEHQEDSDIDTWIKQFNAK